MKTPIRAIAFLSVVSISKAALVVPTSITYVGTAPELTGLNLDNETNLINGNGLSGTPDESNYTSITHVSASFAAPGNAWVTTDPGGFPSDFFASNGGTTIVFEVTFDDIYELTDFISWGYHFGSLNANDISAITIEFGIGNYDSSTGSLPVALASTAGSAVTTPLGGPIQADQLRITVTDNHFGTVANGGDRVGLAEIRFLGSPVPEPASVGLLGLAGLGFLARRRR